MFGRSRQGKRLSRQRLPLALLFAVFTISCNKAMDQPNPPMPPDPQKPAESLQAETIDYAAARARMVAQQLAGRDISNQRVLDAMRQVPRHQFVPVTVRHRAYDDSPLPIGHGQTISQPYIVALMTQLVDPQPQKKALDIGTGSGYQAAVLAELVKSVHSIEIVEPLAEEARRRLQAMKYDSIQVRHGDGYHGWESEAPFDIIIVAAAPDHVPPALVDQLARGGTMVIPVGDRFQKLMLVQKNDVGVVVKKSVAPVAFVPMTGSAVK